MARAGAVPQAPLLLRHAGRAPAPIRDRRARKYRLGLPRLRERLAPHAGQEARRRQGQADAQGLARRRVAAPESSPRLWSSRACRATSSITRPSPSPASAKCSATASRCSWDGRSRGPWRGPSLPDPIRTYRSHFAFDLPLVTRAASPERFTRAEGPINAQLRHHAGLQWRRRRPDRDRHAARRHHDLPQADDRVFLHEREQRQPDQHRGAPHADSHEGERQKSARLFRGAARQHQRLSWHGVLARPARPRATSRSFCPSRGGARRAPRTRSRGARPINRRSRSRWTSPPPRPAPTLTGHMEVEYRGQNMGPISKWNSYTQPVSATGLITNNTLPEDRRLPGDPCVLGQRHRHRGGRGSGDAPQGRARGPDGPLHALLLDAASVDVPYPFRPHRPRQRRARRCSTPTPRARRPAPCRTSASIWDMSAATSFSFVTLNLGMRN